jgi:hypothetical protein
MELRIDSYIQKLLFNHNCVVIPSFGGFVGNYKGAEIHPTQHIFNPPCKQLVFNKNLHVNDGLLAQFIAQEEQVSYQEALEIIDKEVFKIKHLLSQGERVNLKSIGYLRLDVEKNIQFSPSSLINYATDSFGLTSFQSSAIKRGNFVAQVENTFKDRPAVKGKVKFKKYRKFALPLLILPVAITLFLFPFSGDLKDKIQLQTSGYFSNSATKTYVAKAHDFNLALANIEPMQMLEENVVESLPEAPLNEFAVAETTMVAVAKIPAEELNADAPYTLIAGCFAVIENAEKQIAQLKQKNIEASIIGKTKNGLYRVGCGSFQTSNEANQAMLNLKAQQTDVWVLKN